MSQVEVWCNGQVQAVTKIKIRSSHKIRNLCIQEDTIQEFPTFKISEGIQNSSLKSFVNMISFITEFNKRVKRY